MACEGIVQCRLPCGIGGIEAHRFPQMAEALVPFSRLVQKAKSQENWASAIVGLALTTAEKWLIASGICRRFIRAAAKAEMGPRIGRGSNSTRGARS